MRISIVGDEPFDASSRFKHKYGGTPTFVERLPDCTVCRVPLDMIFQFDLSDPRLKFLRLEKMRFMPVLTCFGCDLAWAEHLYYRVDGSGVTTVRSDATDCFYATEETCLERSIRIEPVPEDQLPSHYDNVEVWADRLDEMEIGKHQLGGFPFWVQDKHEVSCPECDAVMRFIGQADSDDWETPDTDTGLAGHMFGDVGMLYVFYCDRCNILCTGGNCY